METKSAKIRCTSGSIRFCGIEILKPDLVVFAKGPNYDFWLEQTFKGLSKTKIEGYNEREFCSITHSSLPPKAVRIYHPGYHLRKGENYRFELANDVLKVLMS